MVIWVAIIREEGSIAEELIEVFSSDRGSWERGGMGMRPLFPENVCYDESIIYKFCAPLVKVVITSFPLIFIAGDKNY